MAKLQPQQITQAIQLGKSLNPVDKDPTPPIKLKNGQLLTVDQFNTSAKNGMPFTSMNTMADYINGWARKLPPDLKFSPYYRTYGGQNIPGGDMAILHAKYYNNPQVMQILQRNIAKPGEVPMYSPEDSDVIKKLLSVQPENK
jgi:hypothetical protein